MRFTIKAHAEFEADNIDDAAKRLSEHFAGMLDADKDDQFVIRGSIEIAPSDDSRKNYLPPVMP